MHKEIVLGVDDSACVTDAVLWAADEARRRGLALRLAHVAVTLVKRIPPPIQVHGS